MHGVEAALAGYGLPALFIVMLLKEIGVPVPVPSDLIMITAGVQLATGAVSLIELIAAVEIAIVAGSSVQFLVVRGAGRPLIFRFSRLVGLSPERIEAAAASVRRRGPVAVLVGLNLPAARAGVVVGAGLSGLAYPAFAPAMIAGSTLFYGWHVALGYAVGPAATTILERLSLSIGPVALALAALGLIGWLALRRRRKDGAEREGQAVDPLRSWTEAACPACLAISTAQRLTARESQ